MLCPCGKLTGGRPVRQGNCDTSGFVLDGDRRSLGCGGSAFAPEVVGGKAEHEQRDGDGQISEL
jgi:hypothetical protein